MMITCNNCGKDFVEGCAQCPWCNSPLVISQNLNGSKTLTSEERDDHVGYLEGYCPACKKEVLFYLYNHSGGISINFIPLYTVLQLCGICTECFNRVVFPEEHADEISSHFNVESDWLKRSHNTYLFGLIPMHYKKK